MLWKNIMKSVKNVKIKRKNIIKKVFVGGLLLLSGFLLFIGGEKFANFLYTSSFFTINKIIIEGNNYLKEEKIKQILQKSNVRLKKNIFAVCLKEVGKRLEDCPRIKEVLIRRKFPQTLIVKITERRPRAKIKQARKSKVLEIDKEGVILGEVESITRDLPLISGIKSQEEKEKLLLVSKVIKYIISFQPLLFDKISEINVEDVKNIILFLSEEPIEIRLGKEKIKKRLNRLNSILNYNEEKGIKLKYIDLRFEKDAYGTLQ